MGFCLLFVAFTVPFVVGVVAVVVVVIVIVVVVVVVVVAAVVITCVSDIFLLLCILFYNKRNIISPAFFGCLTVMKIFLS